MIPLATTTITVKRVAETEPGEGRTTTTLARAVRAHIGSMTGTEQLRPGGGRAVVSFRLDCDLLPSGTILHTDQVVDETTGTTYEVAWARERRGLGVDHIEAGLSVTTGVAA